MQHSRPKKGYLLLSKDCFCFSSFKRSLPMHLHVHFRFSLILVLKSEAHWVRIANTMFMMQVEECAFECFSPPHAFNPLVC